MTSVFFISMALLFAYTLMSDRKELRKATKVDKFLYYTLGASVLGILVSMVFRMNIPMPTEFFVYQVSPLIYNFVMTKQ